MQPTEVSKRRLPKIIRTGRSLLQSDTYNEGEDGSFGYLYPNPAVVYYVYTQGLKCTLGFER